MHHAIRAWSKDALLMRSTILHYFPEAVTTEKQMKYSRLLQGIGYQALFEEIRRQVPICTMAMNWFFNEPWPAANNSLISGNGDSKPAYYNVCRALRPDMVSVRFEKFDHRPGAPIYAEVYILAEQAEFLDGTVRIRLIQDGNEKSEINLPVHIETPGLSNKIGEVTVESSELHYGLFQLQAEFLSPKPQRHCVGASSYDLLLK